MTRKKKLLTRLGKTFWNQTWKKVAIGAGSGATFWELIKTLVNTEFTDPQTKALVWAAAFLVVSVIAVGAKRGSELHEFAEETSDGIQEELDDVIDGNQ